MSRGRRVRVAVAKHMITCSPAPCYGACSTGSLGYTYNSCDACPGCSCLSITTPCRTLSDCTGSCEGGTLGVSTFSCSARCSEYCACKTTTRRGLLGDMGEAAPSPLTDAPQMVPTPTLTGGGVRMTGVVIPKVSLMAYGKPSKRYRTTHVTTTIFL